ncbi:MAG: PepSY domain-containing protein [Pseudomonadota bacterium]|nr:PepSY domain-containing protein [Pseudomonadota bacterium]
MRMTKKAGLFLLCLCPVSGLMRNGVASSFDTSAIPVAFLFRNYFRPSLDNHEAKAIATKVVNGQVIKTTLVKQMGGSGIHYAFIINHDGTLNEVDVDAVTGRILRVTPEGPFVPGKASPVAPVKGIDWFGLQPDGWLKWL